ncbi:Protein of unknown function (DUF3054) [Glaciihabitans tibetensis]|uniref:DUF3054 family protein n=1 Tax=Glaciihabitans tibetensis TaxID=1266600 RepID=A0A2T0VII0_9MICO|nr:DUF3054 domain-containing protein [Glaciihabitans tibetensis]PRY70018.1 Protein of unknown function (DUF3054) [Glaciihabitans tibetensis]
MSTSRSPRRRAVIAVALDAFLVLTFAVIGRSSHSEALDPSGLFGTAWPFLVGLLLGWLVTRGWRAPMSLVRTGLGVWGLTVGGGLLLRAVSGQGTAPGFVIVTTVVLALFLLGWRAVARWLPVHPKRG